MIRRLLVRRTLKCSGTARGFENLILFAAPVYLQRAQVVYEVPRVIGLNDIRKRRHGRAIQAGHENAIQILVSNAALETRIISRRREVVRMNALILTVREGRSSWAVPLNRLARTLPALHLREQTVA